MDLVPDGMAVLACVHVVERDQSTALQMQKCVIGCSCCAKLVLASSEEQSLAVCVSWLVHFLSRHLLWSFPTPFFCHSPSISDFLPSRCLFASSANRWHGCRTASGAVKSWGM